MIHDEWDDISLVDYNRSGVPLIEIVSEPDMRSAQEVIAYLEKLRLTIQYLGASDCKLQEGSMRADVNLSVRPVGSSQYGTRTEMKNISSFKAITHAILGERARQIELLEEGKNVEQETRRWDENKESSYAMRSKEDAKDYRYFPDPDLSSLVISDSWIDEIRKQQPPLKEERMHRYIEEYKLPEYDADIITQSKNMADFFEETCRLFDSPKKVSNWLMTETMRLQKENELEADDIPFSPQNLASLIKLNEEGKINSTVAKQVFEKIFADDIDPVKYVEENDLATVEDEDEMSRVIMQVIEDNPKSVEDYRSGKKKAMGFLVGQTMKIMKGRANPAKVNEIVRSMLDK